MRVEQPLDDHRLRLGLGHCREGAFELIGAADQARLAAPSRAAANAPIKSCRLMELSPAPRDHAIKLKTSDIATQAWEDWNGLLETAGFPGYISTPPPGSDRVPIEHEDSR